MRQLAVARELDEAATVALRWLASRSPAAAADSAAQVLALRDHLYAAWYAACRQPKSAVVDAVPFVQQLRVAHAGSRIWSPGWIARHVSTAGRVVGRRDGADRLIAPGDFVNLLGPGLPPVPGTPLLAVDRYDSTALLPGYWVTHSRDWFPPAPALVRLYWNVEARGAAALTRALTALLPPDPYCLKVPADPPGFSRKDAVVVYLRSGVGAATWARIRSVHAAVSSVMVDEVPPLTCRLDAGLSVAVHEAFGESFGQHRSRLIAEAVRPVAHLAPADVSAAIRQRFAAAGVDVDRPWTTSSATALGSEG